MAIPISLEDPIIVIVKENGWKAYPLHQSPNEHDELLLKILNDIGGINTEVDPGTYLFNKADLDGKNMVVSLERIYTRT